MTVQFEEVEYCKVKINYQAAPELIEEKKKDAIKLIKQSGTKVPGFRMGKATDLAIRVNMKDQIEAFVTRELTNTAYEDALYETQARPMGMPDIHHAKLDGKSFKCEMTITKKPDIELNEYTGFEIPEPHLDVTIAQEAERLLQEARVAHGETVMYDEGDFVQEGDQITMDAEVSVDDEKVEEMCQSGAVYEVGTNSVPEFDQQLYGMKAGESKTFHIVFEDSEKYLPSVRGKRVQFDVTVHVGTKTKPAALDDELAKKFGLENMNELEKQANATAAAQLQQKRMNKVQDQVMRKILDNHQDFEIPHWMILQSAQGDVASKGLSWDELTEEQIDTLLENHERDVRLSLLLDEIRECEPESAHTEQELITKLREQLTSQGRDANQIISSAAQNGYLAGILAALKDELTMKWLTDQSTVTGSDTDTDTDTDTEEEQNANTEENK